MKWLASIIVLLTSLAARSEPLDGVLPKGAVPRAVWVEKPAVVRCAEAKLARDPTSAEKTTVQLVVEPNGRVTTASIEEPAPKDQRYAQCLLSVVKSLRLPRPHGGRALVK